MVLVCILFTAHQPIRLNREFVYSRVKWIAEGSSLLDKYFDESLEALNFRDWTQRCYRPALGLLSKLCSTYNSPTHRFKFSLAPSGLFLEQASRYDPQIIATLRSLVSAGATEILGCPHFFSLSSLYDDPAEFKQEVKEQVCTVSVGLGAKATTFVNTDFMYNDSVAGIAEELGFEAAVVEGDRRLGASATKVYSAGPHSKMKLILRHPDLSNELAAVSHKEQEGPRVAAAKYAEKLLRSEARVILVSVELEAMGTPLGRRILAVLGSLPEEAARTGGLTWATPAEAARAPPEGTVIVPAAVTVCKADDGTGVSRWLGSPLQRLTFERITALKPLVSEVGDKNILRIWQTLQQGTILLDMSESAYDWSLSSPYQSCYGSSAEAYAVFNSVYADFEGKVATVLHRMKQAKTQQQAPAKDVQKQSLFYTMPPPSPTREGGQTVRYQPA